MTPRDGTPAVIYLRVSTEGQGDSGLGMEAQEATARAECERRGWGIIMVVAEAAGSRGKRPGWEKAMATAAHHGGVLVVAKDDRASRSTLDTLMIHDRAQSEGWHFFACNMPNVDTTTPDGRFMATMFAAFAELERGRISERTKAALQAKKARGEKLGPKNGLSKDMQGLIISARSKGMSYQQVADYLNHHEIRGPRGGWWYKQTVRDACVRYELEEVG